MPPVKQIKNSALSRLGFRYVWCQNCVYCSRRVCSLLETRGNRTMIQRKIYKRARIPTFIICYCTISKAQTHNNNHSPHISSLQIGNHEVLIRRYYPRSCLHRISSKCCLYSSCSRCPCLRRKLSLSLPQLCRPLQQYSFAQICHMNCFIWSSVLILNSSSNIFPRLLASIQPLRNIARAQTTTLVNAHLTPFLRLRMRLLIVLLPLVELTSQLKFWMLSVKFAPPVFKLSLL